MSAKTKRIRPPRERGSASHSGSIRAHLVHSVSFGLFIALGFSVIAAIPVLLMILSGERGLRPLWIFPFYLIGGIGGGALVGLLRPLQDRYWGRLISAYLVLVLIYGGGTLTLLPMLVDADPSSVRGAAAAWLVVSLIGAPIYVRIFSSDTSRSRRGAG